ncbi:MAG: transcription antitermination factor NusB [Kiritimatiellae bacterium]|nr:transcription antitermination factor NusB [Kiritimatiellia bacterium]
MNTRREAIFIITRWLLNREFPDRIIGDSPDRAFVIDLTYTTIRGYATLRWVLERFIKKMPQGETLATLLLGAAQILLMDDVADHAAVFETVEAAKTTSKKSAGLVNGVLRNIIRSREEILLDLATQPLALRKSHPEALAARWIARFGEEESGRLFDWNNTPAETFISRKPPGDGVSSFELVPRGTRVVDLPGYEEGEFIVQDPATSIAIELLDLKPGLKVLDACAAPGGKTVQIAWRVGDPLTTGGKVLALDLHEERIATIRENLHRTRLEWVEVEQANLMEPINEIREKHAFFDRILLDVPCSNSGVLRRRPDARWRWSLRRMEKLVIAQQKIIAHAAKLLAPGGILVYSTCSLEPEENQELIAAFIKRYSRFKVIRSLERIPTRDGCDGAFACALTHKSDPS